MIKWICWANETKTVSNPNGYTHKHTIYLGRNIEGPLVFLIRKYDATQSNKNILYNHIKSNNCSQFIWYYGYMLHSIEFFFFCCCLVLTATSFPPSFGCSLNAWRDSVSTLLVWCSDIVRVCLIHLCLHCVRIFMHNSFPFAFFHLASRVDKSLMPRLKLYIHLEG